MGFTDSVSGKKFHGCILADEMGLGKSIQAVALIWTALRQGPSGDPIARKAVVVCPSSLVGNWAKELEKWLPGKIKPILLGESCKNALARIADFQYKDHDVLIISYDQLKIRGKDLAKVWNIDLVVCDEGHRLKNAEIKTSQSVRLLKTPRRVILSGTPIQVD
jgi:SNF2 family DNA or RNA helicase